MEITSNQVKVSGVVANVPEFSHEVFGESFYFFSIKSIRLSGTADLVPVLASEREVKISELNVGDFVTIDGDFRSYNSNYDGKTHLILSVFVRSLTKEEGYESSNINQISLTGFLCKKPIFRQTPLGREITDILLAVNRPYGKSDYIPCILWGRNARFGKDLDIGQQLTLTGRIQSREYEKLDDSTGILNKKTVYEVSVLKLELV